MGSKTTEILLNMKQCYDNIQSEDDRKVVSSVMGTFSRISKQKLAYYLVKIMFSNSNTYQPAEEAISKLIGHYDVSHMPDNIYAKNRTKHLIDFLCERTRQINDKREDHFPELRYEPSYIIGKIKIMLHAFDERGVDYDYINIYRIESSGRISKRDILTLLEIIRDKWNDVADIDDVYPALNATMVKGIKEDDAYDRLATAGMIMNVVE